MNRDLGAWLIAAGAIVLAFGGIRLYSVVLADPSAAAEIRASEGGVWVVALAIGVALMAVGWWVRSHRRAA
jgi:hypothetical protein